MASVKSTYECHFSFLGSVKEDNFFAQCAAEYAAYFTNNIRMIKLCTNCEPVKNSCSYLKLVLLLIGQTALCQFKYSS